MIADSIDRALEFLKLNPGYLIVGAAISGAALFFGHTFPEESYVRDVAENYSGWIALVFWTCSSVLGGIPVSSAVNRIKRANDRRSLKNHKRKRITERLRFATDDEKYVLQLFIMNKRETVSFDFFDQITTDLDSAGILHRIGSGPSYRLDEVAREYLNEDKERVMVTDPTE